MGSMRPNQLKRCAYVPAARQRERCAWIPALLSVAGLGDHTVIQDLSNQPTHLLIAL
jgi:hypothetical protein